MHERFFLEQSAPSNVSSATGIVAATAVLQRVLPRGKGAVPRVLGRLLLPSGSQHGRYINTRHGAMMLLSSQSLDVYATMYNDGLAWDYPDFEICLGMLPEGTVFYDVGANVGYESLEMCKIRDDRILVYAFEPHVELAELLAASAALNEFDTLRVLSCLLGDEDGERDFFLAPDSIHASAVIDSGRDVVATRKSMMYRIDSLVGEGVLPIPHALKMDTEGSEHLIFAGGQDTFREHAPHVFLEFATNLDPGRRIQTAIESLAKDVSRYRIYGYPNRTYEPKYPAKLFPLECEEQWDEVHGIVLRNVELAVHDEAMFG